MDTLFEQTVKLVKKTKVPELVELFQEHQVPVPETYTREVNRAHIEAQILKWYDASSGFHSWVGEDLLLDPQNKVHNCHLRDSLGRFEIDITDSQVCEIYNQVIDKLDDDTNIEEQLLRHIEKKLDDDDRGRYDDDSHTLTIREHVKRHNFLLYLRINRFCPDRWNRTYADIGTHGVFVTRDTYIDLGFRLDRFEDLHVWLGQDVIKSAPDHGYPFYIGVLPNVCANPIEYFEKQWDELTRGIRNVRCTRLAFHYVKHIYRRMPVPKLEKLYLRLVNKVARCVKASGAGSHGQLAGWMTTHHPSTVDEILHLGKLYKTRETLYRKAFEMSWTISTPF